MHFVIKEWKLIQVRQYKHLDMGLLNFQYGSHGSLFSVITTDSNFQIHCLISVECVEESYYIAIRYESLFTTLIIGHYKFIIIGFFGELFLEPKGCWFELLLTPILCARARPWTPTCSCDALNCKLLWVLGGLEKSYGSSQKCKTHNLFGYRPQYYYYCY